VRFYRCGGCPENLVPEAETRDLKMLSSSAADRSLNFRLLFIGFLQQAEASAALPSTGQLGGTDLDA